MITITTQIFQVEQDGKPCMAVSVNRVADDSHDMLEHFLSDAIMSIIQDTTDLVAGKGMPVTDEVREKAVKFVGRSLNLASVRTQEKPDRIAEQALLMYAQMSEKQNNKSESLKSVLEKMCELDDEDLEGLATAIIEAAIRSGLKEKDKKA